MVEKTVSVSTKHEQFGEVETKFGITLPESFEEAAGEAFFGSEEEAIKALQAAVQQRKMNAARAVLREVDEEPKDWNEFARSVAESYTPGRRGGFAAPIQEEELAAAATDIDALKELLRAKGVRLT